MKTQDKINMILIVLVILLGAFMGWMNQAKGNHGNFKNGLNNNQVQALSQACLIRAYELRLEKADRITWCSCIIVNLDIYFKTHEPVFQDDLWDEVYLKCTTILQKES